MACGGIDDVLIGDVSRRPRAAIAGVDELDCARGGHERDGGEIKQSGSWAPRSGFLQAQPVALHGTEYLLNPPTQPIKAHDLLSSGELSASPATGRVVSSRQVIAVWPFGGDHLAHLDIGECHGLGIDRSSMSRPDDAYASRLHPHPGGPPASPGRDGGTRISMVPNSRQSDGASNRRSSSTSLRSCAARTIKCTSAGTRTN